ERRRGESERQGLLTRLVSIQSEERRRISRELHDQIGQQVAALTMRLKTLESSGGNGADLDACQVMLSELARQGHDLAVEIRPTSLDEFGLAHALRSYAEDWAERHQIRLDFHEGDVAGRRFSAPVEEAAYRIALEGLANVAKHSKAKQASLILERKD